MRENELLRQLGVKPEPLLGPLRERRTLREAGYDPDEAKVRDEKCAEG